MDFLKTLLAYMALMATLGVQEGPAPQTVSTPTPLPAHVTASPVPFQTQSPTATPAPSIAPGPALTPNKRYSKVEFGDKGTAVRKLQNQLIELGFMPKGSADGQYGYQTYNAVKDFQRANGLDVDGVAGPITLTYLYENPNIITLTGNTPVPTATPTPSLPPLESLSSSQESTPAVTQSITQPVTQPATQPSGQGITSAVTVAPNRPTGSATARVTPTAEPTPVPSSSVVAPVTSLSSSNVVAHITPKYPNYIFHLEDSTVISGESGEALYYNKTVNGLPGLVPLDIWMNDFNAAVVSLPQLANAMKWPLTTRGNTYTLTACGYSVTIDFQANGLMVLVDGHPIFVPDEDAFLYENTLFVSEGFLRTTINANTVLDISENSLVLFCKDKSVANAQD